MRPINHMTLICDHSYDLGTWPTIFIIKAWSIPTSASLFIQILSHYQFQYPRHYFYVMTTFWSLSSLRYAFSAYCGPRTSARRFTRKTTSRFQWWWHKRGLPWSLLMKATGRLLLNQRLFGFQWWCREKGFLWLLLMKATDGSHGKWWAGRLAGRNISLILEDINISFNHLLYYSMSEGDGRVVANKWRAW